MSPLSSAHRPEDSRAGGPSRGSENLGPGFIPAAAFAGVPPDLALAAENSARSVGDKDVRDLAEREALRSSREREDDGRSGQRSRSRSRSPRDGGRRREEEPTGEGEGEPTAENYRMLLQLSQTQALLIKTQQELQLERERPRAADPVPSPSVVPAAGPSPRPPVYQRGVAKIRKDLIPDEFLSAG